MNETLHPVSFHGQIISIEPSDHGFVAQMMTDNGRDGTYLTVEQANTFKVGDIVDWQSSYDMWGVWAHLDYIRRAKQ